MKNLEKTPLEVPVLEKLSVNITAKNENELKLRINRINSLSRELETEYSLLADMFDFTM